MAGRLQRLPALLSGLQLRLSATVLLCGAATNALAAETPVATQLQGEAQVLFVADLPACFEMDPEGLDGCFVARLSCNLAAFTIEVADVPLSLATTPEPPKITAGSKMAELSMEVADDAQEADESVFFVLESEDISIWEAIQDVGSFTVAVGEWGIELPVDANVVRTADACLSMSRT